MKIQIQDIIKKDPVDFEKVKICIGEMFLALKGSFPKGVQVVIWLNMYKHKSPNFVRIISYSYENTKYDFMIGSLFSGYNGQMTEEGKRFNSFVIGVIKF